MSPSFLEGDYVVSISSKLVKLKEGDVIVFDHKNYGFLIKEIIEKNNDGYFVQGTYPASTNTKLIGLVTSKMIRGKVILKIKSKGNKRP